MKKMRWGVSGFDLRAVPIKAITDHWYNCVFSFSALNKTKPKSFIHVQPQKHHRRSWKSYKRIFNCSQLHNCLWFLLEEWKLKTNRRFAYARGFQSKKATAYLTWNGTRSKNQSAGGCSRNLDNCRHLLPDGVWRKLQLFDHTWNALERHTEKTRLQMVC